jgi:hypothetical protein
MQYIVVSTTHIIIEIKSNERTGQYTQTAPVYCKWGHRWGLAITATTATPEAVRTGLVCRN